MEDMKERLLAYITKVKQTDNEENKAGLNKMISKGRDFNQSPQKHESEKQARETQEKRSQMENNEEKMIKDKMGQMIKQIASVKNKGNKKTQKGKITQTQEINYQELLANFSEEAGQSTAPKDSKESGNIQDFQKNKKPMVIIQLQDQSKSEETGPENQTNPQENVLKNDHMHSKSAINKTSIQKSTIHKSTVVSNNAAILAKKIAKKSSPQTQQSLETMKQIESNKNDYKNEIRSNRIQNKRIQQTNDQRQENSESKKPKKKSSKKSSKDRVQAKSPIDSFSNIVDKDYLLAQANNHRDSGNRTSFYSQADSHSENTLKKSKIIVGTQQYYDQLNSFSKKNQKQASHTDSFIKRRLTQANQPMDLGVHSLEQVVEQCFNQKIISQELFMQFLSTHSEEKDEQFIKLFVEQRMREWDFRYNKISIIDHRRLCQLLVKMAPSEYIIRRPDALNKKIKEFLINLYEINQNEYRQVVATQDSVSRLTMWRTIQIKFQRYINETQSQDISSFSNSKLVVLPIKSKEKVQMSSKVTQNRTNKQVLSSQRPSVNHKSSSKNVKNIKNESLKSGRVIPQQAVVQQKVANRNAQKNIKSKVIQQKINPSEQRNNLNRKRVREVQQNSQSSILSQQNAKVVPQNKALDYPPRKKIIRQL